LRNEITIRIEVEDEETGTKSYREVEEKLEDHPEVQKEWNNYLKNHWNDWMQRHNEWEKLQKLYGELYLIYQSLLKSREEYELILGIGLLAYKNKEEKLFKRHLIVANAELKLNLENGRLTLAANPDGCYLRIDSNMFENELSQKVEEDVGGILEEIGNDPFDLDNVEKCLKIILNSVFLDGEYKRQFEPIKNSEKPVVTFAPAIILRKRSTKGLVNALKNIERLIDENAKVSDIFANLVDMSSHDCGENNEESRAISSDEMIFFPKLCNEEQKAIVQKINRSRGVLVQGPPGTGKSHTIANLICHLLAKGQRILITAKTSRALSVLREQLPENIRSLAISLLGTGAEEKQLLEQSVNSILHKSNFWSEKKETRKRQELEQKLDTLKQKLERDRQRLRDIIESETIAQSVACDRYSGKAKEIAENVNGERNNYSWFKDNPQSNKEFSLLPNKLLNVLHEMRKNKARKEELALDFEAVDFSYNEFVDLVYGLKNIPASESASNNSILKMELSRLSIDVLKDFLFKIQSLYEIEQRFNSLPDKWIASEFNKMKTGSSILCDIQEKINAILPSIKNVADIADDYNISFPDDYNIKQIHDDALMLQDLVQDGKSMSRLNLFMPKSTRDCLYIFENIKINGKTCSKNAADLENLIKILNFRIGIEKIWKILKDFITRDTESPYSLQIIEIRKTNDTIKEIIKTKEIFDKLNEYLEFTGVHIDISSSQNLSNVIVVLNDLLAGERRAELSKKISSLEQQLAIFSKKENIHPVMGVLLKAVRERDTEKYKEGKLTLDSLIEERRIFLEFKNRLREIGKVIPATIKEMAVSCYEPHWEDRIKQIENAWYWAQANDWITNYVNKDDVPQLKVSLKQTEDNIGSIIAELASLSAWSFCVNRLTSNHRRHMEAWQLSVRKLGKGTGKHANRHRREAQRHLAECREAVPAWIMPLHSVWNNVNTELEIFDLVIVDEASQCGLEALPLFYLAKKILIVGDDKQISPDNVGVKRDEVTQWKNEYLHDVSDLGQFDIDSSLFDIGKIMFSANKVTLREHFRCMPEIIKFSNELCYSSTPLIPMKQYGTDRLSPLEHVFLNNGYKEGDGQAAHNKVEAEVIANRIAQLCGDEKYDGKSIGVVILQGKNQASLIEKLLLEKLGQNKIAERRIVCGESSQFQGDERDIILLSMVVANNDKFRALTGTKAEQRFNVAMSRAKEQVILFHSVRMSALSPSCLRRKLIEFFERKNINSVAGITLEELEKLAYTADRSYVNASGPFESWFEVDVALEIMRRGYRITIQHEIAGRRIDLVVERGQSKLAVECDGDYWQWN
jgi:superfamily I DNA and/or RNA helicase